MLRYTILIMLSLVGIRFAIAQQINMYNGGALITVQNGATLSIGGDYIDASNSKDFGEDPVTAEVLDAPIFLSGTMRISGDIVNNSGIDTKLIFEFENPVHTGKVILAGNTIQSIGGSAPVYFE